MSDDSHSSVLYVDDDGALCDLVSTYLEREHEWLSVTTANGVPEARELVDGETFDCIVSDYDMPRVDGLEFLSVVRDTCPEMPFVLYTGKGSEEIASKAISAGVDEYLQKGQGTDQYTVLGNRIRNLIRRRQAEAAVDVADERYHNLVDTAPVPIILFRADESVAYANDAAVDFLDADDEAELSTHVIPDFLAEGDRETALERMETLFREQRAMPEIQFTIRTLSGERKEAVVATAPGVYRGEPVGQAIVRVVDPE